MKIIKTYIFSLSIVFLLYNCISASLWVILSYIDFKLTHTIPITMAIWLILPATLFAIIYSLLTQKIRCLWMRSIVNIILLIVPYLYLPTAMKSIGSITLVSIQNYVLLPIMILNIILIGYLAIKNIKLKA